MDYILQIYVSWIINPRIFVLIFENRFTNKAELLVCIGICEFVFFKILQQSLHMGFQFQRF